MRNGIAERLGEFTKDLSKLRSEDVSNPNYKTWITEYVSYVEKGGDRPPHKPPTP